MGVDVFTKSDVTWVIPYGEKALMLDISKTFPMYGAPSPGDAAIFGYAQKRVSIIGKNGTRHYVTICKD